jgi:hypothetical protein
MKRKEQHLKVIYKLQRKCDEIRESPQVLIPPPGARRLLLLLLRTLGRELPNIGGYQQVYHRFISLLHGDQLRDLHMSVSARSLSCRIPHLLSECCLLVFLSAAVAEEMLPHLAYRPTSAKTPREFVIVSVSEPFRYVSTGVCPDCSQ